MIPFPVSEQLLRYFATHLANENLCGAPQTIKSYLAAVRNMHILLGFPDPRDQSSLPLLKRVQAGISRIRMLRGSQSRVRLPITAQILAQIRTVLDSSAHPHKVVLWAIAAMAFFGFFRLGELLPETPSSFNPTTDLVWGCCSEQSRKS